MALVLQLDRRQKLKFTINKDALLKKLKEQAPGKIINHMDSIEPHYIPWADLCDVLSQLDIEVISRFNTEAIIIADRVIQVSKHSKYNSSSGL